MTRSTSRSTSTSKASTQASGETTPATEPHDEPNQSEVTDEGVGTADAPEVEAQRQAENPPLAPKNDGPDAAARAGLGESTARAVDPALGVVSDAAPEPTPRASARQSGSTSGPLAPPEKTQRFKPTRQSEFQEDAGPRMDEVKIEKPEFVDADGNPLTYEQMFEDGGNTFVTVKVNAWRLFTYPNTVEQGKVRAFRQGRRVQRAEADAVRHSLAAPESV